jgi:serine/threonine-protein kinase
MARVYLATDPFIKRQVAIKVLSKMYTSEAFFQDRLKREAELIASLEHPAIVPIYDFGEHEGELYIVMRYMRGGDLEDKMAQGQLKKREIAGILQRVAEALEAAHQKNIIHRDIKPANIMFDSKDKAFVSDFGIAKSSHPPTGMTGIFLYGTPAYMSPEQVRQVDTIDGRADIYAMGIMLYEMLTGYLPYDEPSPMATAMAHITDPIPPIRAHRHDLPASWDEIIKKAMAKDPADRYDNPMAFANHVRDVVSGRWYLNKLL